MVYDASRAWSFHVKDFLYQLSFEISAQDKTLFYWNRNSQLQGIIKVHVDDFLWGGTNEFKNKIINKLRDTPSLLDLVVPNLVKPIIMMHRKLTKFSRN